MQSVSGYLMAKDNYGKAGNEFALRTVTGKVRFSSIRSDPTNAGRGYDHRGRVAGNCDLRDHGSDHRGRVSVPAHHRRISPRKSVGAHCCS